MSQCTSGLFAVLLLLAGCAVERVSVEPEGRLEVLDALERFSSGILPADWALEGAGKAFEAHLSVVVENGVPALRVSNGEDSFVVVRRTQAMLLATPYLSWGWNVEPHGAGAHPVRLVVGFFGGNPESGSWGSQPFAWLGSALPPHDRALAIVWGDSALRRGTMTLSGDRPNAAPLYTARGGRENNDLWWLETVDLSHLYALVWPGDDLGRVQVVYIGIAAAAAGERPPSAAYVSDIVLSR